jgi:hypothetical protein
MKSFLLSHFPVLFLAFLVLLIAFINYVPGTFLSGGDNLHPEFFFQMNIKRSIFSVWQEYQGLGLLGGMGHAADLLRQLFLLPFSLILETDQIRWFWTFLTLFIGSAGAYFFFLNLIERIRKQERLRAQIIALIGAVFYLLNLSTVQSYFTPFEVFTAHFAFLPWLLLATVNYLTNPDRKNLLLLSIVLFIATPAAYVPTLFIVYIIASFILGLFIIPGFKKFIKRFFKFGLVAFLVNAFWALPFLLFVLISARTNLDAKINQMATDTIYFINKEFGHIWDVALLRGFWFNNVEPNLQGEYSYMLLPWREHIYNPIVTLLGFLIFIVILIGIFAIVKKKNRFGLGMLGVFIFSITMLATATPPFSFLNDFIRDYIPFFGQIFRFPFTKFSILASLMYAFFFAYAIDYLIVSSKKNKLSIYITSLIFSTFVLIVFTLPIFTGNLFYEREKIKIPDEYFKTYEYFKNQNTNKRIANFPQYTFWGWNFYDWGYSGSGFIWYGIEQPILDRAFDVWGSSNENYYWELNHALYSKNPELFKSVLNKYDVDFLLVDKNLISPNSPKSLFINELEEIIGLIPEIELNQDFGEIEIYEFNNNNNSNNFVSSPDSILSVNDYNWSNYDQTYLNYGDYQSLNETDNRYFYPFRELFTGRSQEDITFNVNENQEYIEFEKLLPEYDFPVKLDIPSLITENNTLPIIITARRTGNEIWINYVLQAPQIYLKKEEKYYTVWESKVKELLFRNAYFDRETNLNINGVTNFIIPKLEDGQEITVGASSLTLVQDNILVLSDGSGRSINNIIIPGNSLSKFFNQDESFVSLRNIEKDTFLSLQIPVLNDEYSSIKLEPAELIEKDIANVVNCDNFRKNYFAYFIKEDDEEKLLELSSKNATPCVSFYLPTLDHDQAYLIRIENENIQERGLHFWILNEDQKTAINDTYFEDNKKRNISTVIIPPYEQFGKAYSLHFDNISIGNVNSRNQLGKISINPIPYYFIANLKLVNPNISPETLNKLNLNVKHPNQSLYMIKTQNTVGNSAITLSQTHSPFWKAYSVNNFNIITRSFPFVFGDELKNHVKINNWKNGWMLKETNDKNNSNSFIIIYLPQYLQYIGFAITSGFLVFTFYLFLKSKKDKQNN